MPELRKGYKRREKLADDHKHTFLKVAHFAASVKPIISSGELTLMNGNSESFAICAASAVLPLFGGPEIHRNNMNFPKH